jgi:hypothetical protein
MVSFMNIVHHEPADQHDQNSAADDDEGVGEELGACVMLNIVPCPLKRCEDVDKQQRVEEQKHQIDGDVVLRDIVFGYLVVDHSSKFRFGKDTIFSHTFFSNAQNNPLTSDFVPEHLISSLHVG